MTFYTGLKTDYSYLFNSMSAGGNQNSSNLLNSINLSDYNSIKSGTYYKLLKAYYAKDTATETTKESSDFETKKANADVSEIKNDAGSLYSATSKLSATGTQSLFIEKDITSTDKDGKKVTAKGYDTAAITSAVKDFVKSYNDIVSSTVKSDNMSILRAASSMVKLTDVYSNQLSKVGITVGSDNKLTLDEEAFGKAQMNSVKSLFNGDNSFASNVGGYASSIGSYANAELNSRNTYTQSGSYSALQSGMNYNSFF